MRPVELCGSIILLCRTIEAVSDVKCHLYLIVSSLSCFTCDFLQFFYMYLPILFTFHRIKNLSLMVLHNLCFSIWYHNML
jgi:hypothetical protein